VIKPFLAKIYARIISKKVYAWAGNPIETQQRTFHNLISQAKGTIFGKDYNFESIKTYEDFKNNVPIKDYEALKPYIEKVKQGHSDILWKGTPIYFAKTSGTTSGTKYIPITSESMPYHIAAAKEALLLYIAQTGNASYLNGKMIFLQGSPEINNDSIIKTGRLSGIVAHYVPRYLQKNRLPTWDTNCIDDWEHKVNAIVEETLHQDMRLISGIPSWVQMYFEKLIERKKKPISEIFPNFDLFVYGGVNYEPYRQNMEKLIGKKVDSIELFPASEGFFAYQDKQNEKGMLLLLDHGIFYEFISADKFFDEKPTRISLADVKLGVNYVLIISTNAGLWAYNIGDTIEFTSLDPYRIIVTGRIKHFISAFGEHVIGKEVEYAVQEAMKGTEVTINEFTVAPQVNPVSGLPYHEWFIEFETKPDDLNLFTKRIDDLMQNQNSYYFDLIEGKILRPLVISVVSKNGFKKYMKSIGKLGGQNKIPKLSNDRKMADILSNFLK
jgi:hypothetical protein